MYSIYTYLYIPHKWLFFYLEILSNTHLQAKQNDIQFCFIQWKNILFKYENKNVLYNGLMVLKSKIKPTCFHTVHSLSYMYVHWGTYMYIKLHVCTLSYMYVHWATCIYIVRWIGIWINMIMLNTIFEVNLFYLMW